MAKTKVLVIDNYDSFTYNLVQYLGELGAELEVVRNDKATVAELLERGADRLVVSPGPCTPAEAGISGEAIRAFAEAGTPVLGVCLGHQAIGQAFGGQVTRAPEPVHGKVWQVHHDGRDVFAGIPSPFAATRYHSLIVDRASLPDCLDVTAWTEDGIVMGVKHKELPISGVQFHPESIASEHGHDLLRNFLTLAGARLAAPVAA